MTATSLRGFALAAALGLALASGVSKGEARVHGGEVAPNRLQVLIINGGGSAATNYQSHLLHVQELLGVLRSGGVPDANITILSGDGPDPAADLALRELQPEADFWLLAGTRLEQPLRTAVSYENSRVDGLELRAATRVEVERSLFRIGARLEKGDTLLIYVTDHGTRDQTDPRDNLITLWGAGDSLSVNELRTHLAKLDPQVRVITVMSQCYSGSFANLIWPTGSPVPAGNICGYFSTTADRRAYGCYPENRGLDNIGHAFDFIQGLAARWDLADAHRHVLQIDATPDVPLRTSDSYLETLLQEEAAKQGKELDSFVDELLAEAWRSRAAWEAEIRLLDVIGRNFGSFSPRSLAELREQTSRLAEMGEQLDGHAKAWQATLADANQANLDRFLVMRPDWDRRLSAETVKEMEAPLVRELAGPFIANLAESTRRDESTWARLATLRSKSEAAVSAAYRMEVRLGVVLRMRGILTSLAGRHYLARRGAPLQRAAFEALAQCEDLRLPTTRGIAMTKVEKPVFPPLEDELELARWVLPAWIGIRFGALTEKKRAALGLKPGAAAILAVYPDSPAQEADLHVGDIVTGPPESPFNDPGQIREWTMLAEVDRPVALDVLRDRDRLTVSLVPRPYPRKWPELPGPPKLSSAAPSLEVLRLTAYRGDLPRDLRDGRPHLMFFWATWCGPCKASLPEVLAFESARDTPVIAITDEPAETLDSFFKSFGKPFPKRIATDEYRRSFVALGVSGTPTFVLVDGDGAVRAYSTGYTKSKGLAIPGWTWSSPSSQ